MAYPWPPNKILREFTNAELNDALEASKNNPDDMTPSIIRSCWREWERRHGLANSDD